MCKERLCREQDWEGTPGARVFPAQGTVSLLLSPRLTLAEQLAAPFGWADRAEKEKGGICRAISGEKQWRETGLQPRTGREVSRMESKGTNEQSHLN